MRSISISGSSWNSLIFTVSDKILLRFLRSSSTWKYKTHKANAWACNARSFKCLLRSSLYLWGQLSVVRLGVLLSVGKDGAEGPSQVFFLEVWWLAHQWGQRHGDLHLHSGEVLKETAETTGQSLIIPTVYFARRCRCIWKENSDFQTFRKVIQWCSSRSRVSVSSGLNNKQTNEVWCQSRARARTIPVIFYYLFVIWVIFASFPSSVFVHCFLLSFVSPSFT